MTPAPDEGPAAQLLQLFAVPLALAEGVLDEAANAELAEWILLERELGEGVQRSVVGGWHSRADLPARRVQPLDAFFGTLIEQVRGVHARVGSGVDYEARFMLQAWATVLERGHYVQVHDHVDAHWSAVYYVDAGDCDDAASGRISWINPIGSHRSMPGAELIPTTFSVTPRTGLLAIFPGWLRHSVEPYQGDRPRIVIAANIEVQRRAR
ncbi:putative 2OG-Fe(II) oxygenase [Roseateles sp. P5_E11]